MTDIIGQVFGNLEVEAYYKQNSYGTDVYLCKCKICGRECARAITSLKTKHKGCGFCDRPRKYW